MGAVERAVWGREKLASMGLRGWGAERDGVRRVPPMVAVLGGWVVWLCFRRFWVAGGAVMMLCSGGGEIAGLQERWMWRWRWRWR